MYIIILPFNNYGLLGLLLKWLSGENCSYYTLALPQFGGARMSKNVTPGTDI